MGRLDNAKDASRQKANGAVNEDVYTPIAAGLSGGLHGPENIRLPKAERYAAHEQVHLR